MNFMVVANFFFLQMSTKKVKMVNYYQAVFLFEMSFGLNPVDNYYKRQFYYHCLYIMTSELKVSPG